MLRFQRSGPELAEAGLMQLIGYQGQHAFPVGLSRVAAVAVLATYLFQLAAQVAHLHSFNR